MESESIKTAILSYGMSGSVFHAPLIHTHSGFELKKVWERTKNRSKTRYEYVEIVRNYHEILEDNQIEFVVVNTPDDTHFEFTKQALEAGKHVVVEKPFTQTSEEAKTLIHLAKKTGCMLSVFQNRRWDGDFLTVKEIVEKNLLGRLVEFESHFDRYRKEVNPQKWKEIYSGVLYNLGSHMIDQAIVLFGRPSSVFADLGKLRENAQIEDYYDITLGYEELKVKLKSNYLVREQGPRYILNGTEGSFRKWGIDPQEDDLKTGLMPVNPEWGKEPEADWGLLNTTLDGLHYRGNIETFPGNYMEYYTNIYKHIRGHENLAVYPEDALTGIQVIEAAIKSNAEGKSIPL